MTAEQIMTALGNVQEPDLGKDIVTLNMVKDLKIDGNQVSFTVVLTTPACELTVAVPATTRSGRPSPLISPTAIEAGEAAVVKIFCC